MSAGIEPPEHDPNKRIRLRQGRGGPRLKPPGCKKSRMGENAPLQKYWGQAELSGGSAAGNKSAGESVSGVV